jgi:hypothetical protein
MNTIKLLIEAVTPISHASEVQGNHSLLMTRKQRTSDGIKDIPIVSADSMRHGLRECGATLCLGLAGLLDRPEGPQLTEAALRLLYSGGMLTGRGDASVIKLQRWREVCETLPIVSLMGGCVDAMMIPGKLRVSDMVLICTETATQHGGLLPEGTTLHGFRSHIEQTQRVRFDVTRDPHKQRLLSDGARTSVDGRMLAKESSREQGEIGEKDRGRPMPHSYEAVCAGSLWSWQISHDNLTEVERAILFLTLAHFFKTWRVGGKRGTGHGELRAIRAEECSLPIFAEMRTEADVTGLSAGWLATAKAHMQERTKTLTDLLLKVDA